MPKYKRPSSKSYANLKAAVEDLMTSAKLTFTKPDIVANCSSAIYLKCIDLDDKNVILKPKDMNIGFGTRNIITELKRKDVITNTQTAIFFTDVTKFIISMVNKLFDKSPLEYSVVRNSIIFDPQVLVNENASFFKK